jgi:hypothetical protein
LPTYADPSTGQPLLRANAPNTTEARWAALRGVVLGVVPLRTMFTLVAAKNQEASSRVLLSMYDTTPDPLQYDQAYIGSLAPGAAYVDPTADLTRAIDSREAVEQSFTFAQRTYRLTCEPVRGVVGEQSTLSIVVGVLIFVVGALVTATAVAALHRHHMNAAIERARKRHAEMSSENRALDKALVEKQQLIDQLTTAQRELELANQAKSSFMSYLCHELRSM